MDSRLTIWRRIEDILQCPICAEMFQDARLLPCGHTFCQRCIEQCQASLIGTSCPLCRRDFFISSNGGLSELPKNFIAMDISEVVRTRPRCNTLRKTFRYLVVFIVFVAICVRGLPEEDRKKLSTKVSVICQQITHHISGSKEEEKKDWNSQITSFLQQISGKLFGPKKEEKKEQTSYEKLKEYFQEISKRFWGKRIS